MAAMSALSFPLMPTELLCFASVLSTAEEFFRPAFGVRREGGSALFLFGLSFIVACIAFLCLLRFVLRRCIH